GRLPVVATETNRVGDYGPQLAFGLGKIIEAHFGDVHHDPLVVAIGQHPPGWKGDGLAFGREPDVEVGQGLGDFVDAEAEMACDVVEGVAARERVATWLADYGVEIALRGGKDVGHRRARRKI